MVTEISNQTEFAEKVTAADHNQLIVVDFYAEWCGPCKHIAPKVKEFAETYSDVKFYKVNVDTAKEVAKAEKISAMPTFRLYKERQKVDELVGADAGRLEELIKKHK